MGGATGTFEPGQITVRYGAEAGAMAYRVYARHSRQGASTLDGGASADDDLVRTAMGFRADWKTGLSLSGAVTRGAGNVLYIGQRDTASNAASTCC